MKCRRSDSIEAAAHKRMVENIGDFRLGPSHLELFLFIAVVVLAAAVLAIWGPAAIEALLRELAS